jgi:hypothetical protein
LKITLWALVLAVAWTVALAVVTHSPGLRSTPGMWLGVFGLPGVAIAHWVQSSLHRFNFFFDYSVMFLVNWVFYCTVILGLVSVKSKLSK